MTTENILAPVAALTLPDSMAITATAQRALTFIEGFQITTNEDYALAAEELQAIKSRAKSLETQRTGITGPINDALKAINNLFRGPADLLTRAESVIKGKMLAWQQEQERIAAEARRKAEAEAEAQRKKLEAEAAAAQAEAQAHAKAGTAEDAQEGPEAQRCGEGGGRDRIPRGRKTPRAAARLGCHSNGSCGQALRSVRGRRLRQERGPRQARDRGHVGRSRPRARRAPRHGACVQPQGRVHLGQQGRRAVTAPWCDCPPCASCGATAGITVDRNDRPLPPPWLWCPACGHRWEASAEDRAQAERAQAAWDRHQDEERKDVTNE